MSCMTEGCLGEVMRSSYIFYGSWGLSCEVQGSGLCVSKQSVCNLIRQCKADCLHTQYGSGSLLVVVLHLKQSAGHRCM